jgi:hypothetical protein
VSALASVPAASLEDRVAALDWREVERELDARGAAVIPALLSPQACAQVVR